MRVVSYENSTKYQRCHEKSFRRYICSSNIENVTSTYGIFLVIKLIIDENRESVI